MFQNEWERSLLIYIKSSSDEGELCTYNVSTHGSVKEHVVTVKRTLTEVSCSCKLFEFMGILCRHALKILDILNIKDMIPEHYILKRWTKDATNLNKMDVSLIAKETDPEVEVTSRYRHLCQTFVQISSEASESIEGYELVANYANEIISKLKDVKKRKESQKSVPGNVIQNEPNETVFVDNTNVTKVTGLKRKQPTRRSNTRPKSFIEKAKRKNQTSFSKSPQRSDQQVDYVQEIHFPRPDASMTMELAEGSFPPWCSSQLSQGSAHGSLTQLLRDVSFHDLNKYS
ncbi:PREDICTED: protein FAR1-RELATED SEQUENCE 1-like [Nicotiana attenuata]|uniref:protein FAR1-RELATED SEQUENCE 1-like n=1 Tax=Nicotiana attenuata TaxID=49451 RepID=UPI0009055461|nr:PREDICTED: protein FAR1-RELATED SEQUENCE 1-like [Nicotiana attenuata]XP_019265392.1 PREDICTED: protein FAR1-RELATED SEQUENCE 1-like [Nicotiana attenuata]